MADIPIIFSATMIRALLAGQKTMTRRLAWRRVTVGPDSPKSWGLGVHCGDGSTLLPTPWQRVKPSDRLWTRENMKIGNQTLVYMADDMPVPKGSFAWQDWMYAYGKGSVPSIHQPRWASRITILITATKIEPLQDIDEADADAEGIVTIPRSLTRDGRLDGYGAPGTLPEDASTTRVNGYRALWRKLYGAASWDENPEVVVMSGRVVVANIDSAEARHG